MNVCFFEASHLNVKKHFPNQPLIEHIYEKKWIHTDHCYIMKERNAGVYKDKLFLLPSIFFFALRFLVSIVKQDMFTQMIEALGTSNLACYLSKGTNKKLRKAIDNHWVIPLFEQGQLSKLFDLCEDLMVYEFPLQNQIFTSLNDYITAYTLVSDVRFDEFKAFFYLHLLLLLLFSTGQAAFLLIKYKLKTYRRGS